MSGIPGAGTSTPQRGRQGRKDANLGSKHKAPTGASPLDDGSTVRERFGWRFGDFGSYMEQKKEKLQIQFERERQNIQEEGDPTIFKGLNIYVNGYTTPPQHELRALILKYGGSFDYHFAKLKCTHVVASNLPLAKFDEFKNYKVVKPQFITDSIAAGKLLPWHHYRLLRAPAQTLLTDRNNSRSNVDNDATDDGFDEAEVEENEDEEDEDPAETYGYLPQLGTNARERLSDAVWMAQNTSVAPDFVPKYFRKSRLHYLSTWKNELRELGGPLLSASQKVARPPEAWEMFLNGKRNPRTICHVDMDCYFASVSMLSRPDLQGKPVVVCHSSTAMSEESSSEIASCNYIAREHGIRNGISLGKARQLCRDVQVLPYNFELYKEKTRILYEILHRYADEVQAQSCDEAIIDISSHICACDRGEEVKVARRIQSEILEKTRCNASIGIGPNILLARMATSRAKPAGVFMVPPSMTAAFLAEQKIEQLPGFGSSVAQRIEAKFGHTTCGELQGCSKRALENLLGPKQGETLYNFCRGADQRDLVTESQLRKSVGAEINWGIRFHTAEQVKKFFRELSGEVSQRLSEAKVAGGMQLILKIRKRKDNAGEPYKFLGCGDCHHLSRSMSLGAAVSTAEAINSAAWQLYTRQLPVLPQDLRGIGIHLSNLVQRSDNQRTITSAFGKKIKKNETEKVVSPEITTVNSSSDNDDSEKNLTGENDDFVHLAKDVNKKQELTRIPLPREWAEVTPQMLLQLPPTEMIRWIKHFAAAENNLVHPAETDPSVFEISSSPAVTSRGANNPHQQQHQLLPTMSQIDENVFRELPTQVRKEISDHFDQQLQQRQRSPLIPITTTPKRTGAALAEQSSRTTKRQKTVPRAPLMSPFTRSRIAKYSAEELEYFRQQGWDAAVVLELPEEIKNEMLHSIRQQQQQQKKSVPLPPAPQTSTKEYPALNGSKTEEEIKQMLDAWLTAFPDGPMAEDIGSVGEYFVALVKYGLLERCSLLLKSLRWKTLQKQQEKDDAWRIAYNKIVSNVQITMKSERGGVLAGIPPICK